MRRIIHKSANSEIICVLLNNKWKLINIINKHFSNVFDEVECYVDGLARVQLDGKWGFINEKFEIKVPLIYDDAYNFSCKRAAVGKIIENKIKYGYIKESGKLITSIRFENFEHFKYGKAVVKDDEKVFIINRRGKIKFEKKLDEYIDCLPVFILERNFFVELSYYPYYDEQYNRNIEGDISISVFKKYNGNVLFKTYQNYNAITNGVSIMRIQNNERHFQLILENGKTIMIENEYENIEDFNSFGYSMVTDRNYKYGLIDKNGFLIVPCKYRWINMHDNGIIEVNWFVDKDNSHTAFIYKGQKFWED